MGSADEGQEFGKRPVRRCTAALQQAGDAEDKRTGTYRSHVASPARLPPNEVYRFPIPQSLNDAPVAAGYADQVQARRVLKGVRGYEAQPTVARHRVCGFGDDMHRRLRQSGQYLLRIGEVELR